MFNKQKKQIHRLEDLLVEEVSLVDRAANKRRFLAVKSEDGMGERGAEIVTDENGNLITKKDSQVTPEEPGTEPGVGTDDSSSIEEISVFKSVEEVISRVEKRLSINLDMRRELFQSLNDNISRLNTVINSADMAQIDRGDKPSTLVPVLAAELMEVSKSILALSKMLGGVKKEDDETPVEVDYMSSLNEISLKLQELGSESVQKNEEVVQIEKHFVALTDRITRLTDIVKSQNKKLYELEQVRGQTNVIPVEKGTVKKEEDTSWPLDMNNERTRENVDKSVSFF